MKVPAKIEKMHRTLLPAGILFLLMLADPVWPQTIGISGQAIAWTTLNPAEPFQTQGGLRYIPELSFSLPAGKYTFDGEFSANAWASALWQSDSISADTQLSPYRLWL